MLLPAINEDAISTRFDATHLEFEAVDADGNGPDHARIEFLIERLALCRTDVHQFPFEICERLARMRGNELAGRTFLERGHALERDAEEVRIRELGWIREDGDVAEMQSGQAG